MDAKHPFPTGTFPIGFNKAGLPMGIQVMGKPQSDLSELQLSYTYEQATGWAQKRKAVVTVKLKGNYLRGAGLSKIMYRY